MPRTYIVHVCGGKILVREFVEGRMTREEAVKGRRFVGRKAESVAIVPGRDCVMVVLEGVEGGYLLEGGA